MGLLAHVPRTRGRVERNVPVVASPIPSVCMAHFEPAPDDMPAIAHESLRCLWTIIRELAAGAGRTFDDIDSVRGWLTRQDQCTGKIGVIGFCMGGAYAVALAPGHGHSAGPEWLIWAPCMTVVPDKPRAPSIDPLLR